MVLQKYSVGMGGGWH